MPSGWGLAICLFVNENGAQSGWAVQCIYHEKQVCDGSNFTFTTGVKTPKVADTGM